MTSTDSRLGLPLLDEAPLGRRQVWILASIVLLAATDGFDALAAAFVAPSVSHDWGLGKATLGLILSSSLFGMAAGALGLSPLADVWGRKPLVLTGVLVMTLGSLLSAAAPSAPWLAGSRVLTGLGIGVMVALTTSLAAEFSNRRSRPLAIASTTVGFGLGGVAGGLAAAAILRFAKWQAVFLLGGALGAGLLLLLAGVLVESPAYLLARGDRSRERLDRVLAQVGRAPMPAADVGGRLADPRTGYRALFSPPQASVTLRLASANVLLGVCAYYLLSWLPQLVADAGFTPSTASLVSAGSGVIGVWGGLLLGALGARFATARLAVFAMAAAAVALIGLAYAPPTLAALLVAASTCSFFLSASTAGLYAVMAGRFSSLTLASGMGFVMGVGRLASAFAPAVAGWLFAAGLSRTLVTALFALAALGAAMAVLSLPRPVRPVSGDAAA